MLDQGTAGFSLRAVVACMCQLGSDISQGTSKGSTWKCIHVLIFPRFPKQNKTKLNKEKQIPCQTNGHLLVLYVKLLLHSSETESSQRSHRDSLV